MIIDSSLSVTVHVLCMHYYVYNGDWHACAIYYCLFANPLIKFKKSHLMNGPQLWYYID